MVNCCAKNGDMVNLGFIVENIYKALFYLHSQLKKNSVCVYKGLSTYLVQCHYVGAQWLSGRVLDSRPRGRGFEPQRRHCVVSLSTTERLLMGRKESNQTNKQCHYDKLNLT